MLELDLDLPPGVLLDPPAPDLGQLAARHGAIWFTATQPHCVVDGGRVVEIAAFGADITARPVDGNTLNCRHSVAGGSPSLAMTARMACGFSADLGAVGPCLGLFVIFSAPDSPARTLVAVSAEGSRDYLYLSHDDGTLFLGRRNGNAVASVPAPAAAQRPILALARIDSAGLAVSVDGGPPVSVPDAEAVLEGDVTTFIGCRRQREGLYKTLGAGHIYDAGFLPSIDPFSDDLAPLRQALIARVKGLGADGV
ncbi:MAG: hypothetical protein AAFO80_00350 [Pseudomonadota bacterium]